MTVFTWAGIAAGLVVMLVVIVKPARGYVLDAGGLLFGPFFKKVLGVDEDIK